MRRRESIPHILLLSFVLAFVWSAIAPKDRFTWWLEVMPSLIGLPILIATYKKFPFTPLSYFMMWILAIGMLVGGHYTYSEVPLFDWIRDRLGHKRNNYDRLGHFFQGVCPAIFVRELLLRTTPIKRGGWLFFIVTCICLAQAALYEIIEWLNAVIFGSGATEFLGTQGDEWDAQWDMFLAFIGAMLAMLLLNKWHDRQLKRIESR